MAIRKGSPDYINNCQACLGLVDSRLENSGLEQDQQREVRRRAGLVYSRQLAKTCMENCANYNALEEEVPIVIGEVRDETERDLDDVRTGIDLDQIGFQERVLGEADPFEI